MDFLWEQISDWLKEVLVSGIVSNLTGMFDSTNTQVGNIVGEVGLTPQAWNSGIFSMIQNLSETVVLPIAGAILAFLVTLELIQLVTDKNNLNDVDTWMFFKWTFKSAAAVLILSNTWNIVIWLFLPMLTTTMLGTRNGSTRIAEQCRNAMSVIKSVERVEKCENPPMLYDLTTLQRDANRLLGYTAQQTLDYLQSLYEKKLCTYPRTDSRFLSDDMLPGVEELTRGAASILGVLAAEVNSQRVCNSRKVTDHHAIIPTRFAISADLAALPAAEQEILKLVCTGLLKATSSAYRYAETVVKLDCAGTEFTVKGKTVLNSGWKAYEKAEEKQAILPDLSEGQSVKVSTASVKEGQTAPPKHYTEDTLLSSMETAGAGEIPEDSERKGLGTPATRAGIIEKLVASGLIERKTAKKLTSLHPSSQGVSLITVLPEQLQSPQLTAEWEQELLAIQNGEQDSETFMEGICAMLQDLFQEYKPVNGASILFPSDRETVGKCPRCSSAVRESKKGYFCSNHECHFAIWKNNRFFTAKKKTVAPELVAELLTKGEVILEGCFSERTGKYYDAKIVMEDDGHATNFKMVFDNG